MKYLSVTIATAPREMAADLRTAAQAAPGIAAEAAAAPEPAATPQPNADNASAAGPPADDPNKVHTRSIDCLPMKSWHECRQARKAKVAACPRRAKRSETRAAVVALVALPSSVAAAAEILLQVRLERLGRPQLSSIIRSRKQNSARLHATRFPCGSQRQSTEVSISYQSQHHD